MQLTKAMLKYMGSTNARKLTKYPQIDALNMGGIYRRHIFVRPQFQRGIAWDHTDALTEWHDILATASNKESQHFFGEMAFYLPGMNPTRSEIIDGQQRLVSTAILLSVLRSQIVSLFYDNQSQSINNNVPFNQRVDLIHMETTINKLLYDDDTKHAESSLRFQFYKLNKNDTNIDEIDFKKCLLGMLVEGTSYTFSQFKNDTYSSIRNLNSIYNTFMSVSQSLLNKYNQDCRANNVQPKINVLHNILDAILNRFYVIVMYPTTHMEALNLFISINTTGRKLTGAQTAKAQLAAVIRDDKDYMSKYPRSTQRAKKKQIIKQTMDKWDGIVSILNGSDNVVESYLTTYWHAAHGSLKKADLIQLIPNRIQNVQATQKFIQYLYQNKYVFYSLYSPRKSMQYHHFVQRLTPIYSGIVALDKQHLSHNYYYDVILAMTSHNSTSEEIKKVFNSILRISMRRIFISREHYMSAAQYAWQYPHDVIGIISRILVPSQKRGHSQDVSNKLVMQECEDYRHPITKRGKAFALLNEIEGAYYTNQKSFVYNNLLLPTQPKYSLFALNSEQGDNNVTNLTTSPGNYVLLEPSLIESMPTQSLINKANALQKSSLSKNRVLGKQLRQHSSQLNRIIKERNIKVAKAYMCKWR